MKPVCSEVREETKKQGVPEVRSIVRAREKILLPSWGGIGSGEMSSGIGECFIRREVASVSWMWRARRC